MTVLDRAGEIIEPNANGSSEPIRRGPPNRMNDLVYRDWMKFQKSFFRYAGFRALAEEWVHFFTKAVWPDGRRSRSLLVGMDPLGGQTLSESREVEICSDLRALDDVLACLETRVGEYDFVLVDLRPFMCRREELPGFLEVYAGRMYRALARLLHRERYCCVLVDTEGPGGAGFPLPWSVALTGREWLRLRDEKIGLVEEQGEVFYCLVFQKVHEGRPAANLTPERFRLSNRLENIPAWLIPKPPPRKRQEILHPAKYPETLVAEFLELFTKPGDTVLDPMVGTGSTVVACARSGRNGVGVDLSPEFVEIARARVGAEQVSSLFQEDVPTCAVVQGDATRLDEVPALRGRKVDYCITSPPYWSMLTNPGSENQEARRKKNLKLTYSADTRDLGNVEDYEAFLGLLVEVYGQVAEILKDDGALTVVVKNVKRNHILYPLAWDLAAALCGPKGRYEYAGVTLWCQDDVGIKPFAVGIHWVSNILHHYCLHFRRRLSCR